MKFLKKLFLGLVLLAVIAVATCVAIDLSSGSKFIIPNDSIQYHTKDELKELYLQNKDLLNSVKNSVLSNSAFINAMNQLKEGDIDIYTDVDKECFSEEEWADIVSVFEKLRPYMVMMERKGRPLIFYIVFGTKQQDDITKRTYLYWFPNEEERAYHERPSIFPDGVFTALEDGWYIVEETYPW